MSIADDMMDELGLPTLLEFNGETVTYHPDGGADVELTAVFAAQPSDLAELEPGGQSDVRIGTLLVDKGDLAAPTRKDEVTIRSEQWDIVTIDDAGPGWSLNIRRSVTVEKGAARFRMARI